MRVHICAVGRLRAGPEKDLIDDYLTRFDRTGRALGLGPARVVEVEDKKGGGMVATVMSNMGLAEYLKGLGLTLARTKVGDRYVAEHMRAHGFNLGGEQSGHIILSDVSTTGDGLLAALQVLSVLARTGKKSSVLGHVFEPAPQELVNIRYAGTNPLETSRVKAAMAEAEAMMGEKGRLVVRKSGTEPLIRVMAEALDEAMMKKALNAVVEAVQAEA
mgnify:CR=1 FL=1